ncbi:protein kinase domain protein [Ichthyophthirius multifiliis]|uniref:non-specific serine/threonine protein kinase n=1 Tax=Ichthyophthirius multifiliis TaxID=5932 RepID=G0QWM0_ICHMU|nr:protein kinase domain protein [Ichthyophthirius multifiliis]EGR30379.1 protein kinase domain protein [Ichthyophthirius multifiliis]|eukprot:XP_004031966.1 protein kinase domain protein [Ichthyophthirius multifiliis]
MEKKLKIDDFEMKAVLGKGAYAKVVLVKKKDNQKLYALKILKKEMVENRKQEKHVMTERNLLINLNHPFIIKMEYSFQSEAKLYFCLEYCPGGELFNLLQKREQFNEDQTRFYVSQIVLALEFIHKNNVMYRDLKPENVLIDKQGYIRITDFGLSRDNIKGYNDAKTVCGTPEYLAPEIILKQGYGKAVDWWTLGCLIYELLTGLPPFYNDNNNDMLFEKIMNENFIFNKQWTKQCQNLLQGLLQKNPKQRLGYNGSQEIKEHPWFNNLDWEVLLKKQYKPPFIPQLKSETSLCHFDEEFIQMPINSHNQAESLQGKHKEFEGFTYSTQKI